MKLEDIYEEWKKDSDIDKTELGNEALKIPKLHHKYYQMFTHERLLLRKYEADFKNLKLSKYEFYTMGPTEESRDKGWHLPARGMILKSDLPMYMEADKDIIDMSLRIGMQQEKIELLESIIKSLVNRGFQIKSAIEWTKFTMGA
ncbi:Recombination, repair and ssDNA binding protein UvsY [uncultured Caudovirales phage]|uniref:Recombination, repair and ssDNA binding protein UvsY n=1 Tax=uncultured Caudovirales phage TaxID=2100421 RepID=A0A6J5LED9_9CAUD|nr:Recombination, repair and ssDNA binding protein UvsY [uncultured Caudovirales phage]